MTTQGGARGAFGVEPLQLVGDRVGVFEHPVRQAPECSRVPLVDDRESLDGDAVDIVWTSGELVGPRDVVTGTGREDADVVVPRQPLGNVAGMELRTAVHL